MIIDGHCDVLWKMWENPSLSFDDSQHLHVSYSRMTQFDRYLQNFAIFHLPESYQSATPFAPIRASAMDFREKILFPHRLMQIKTKQDIIAWNQSAAFGGILSLEGADGLVGDYQSGLQECYRHGIRMISLTWNHSNWAADGVYGEQHRGLSTQGRSFIQYMDELGIIIDVSHLSDTAFWQLLDVTPRSIVASHSNARSICPHPRNLDDHQIQAIIARNGIVGINLVPMFIAAEQPNIEALIFHLEHICQLGGAHHIALGTDFDGTDELVTGIKHLGELEHLILMLEKHYNQKTIRQFLCDNWYQYLVQNLPDDQSNSDIDFI